MQPHLVVVRDPLRDDRPRLAQVPQRLVAQRLAGAPVEALDRPVRLRMIRTNPNVLKRKAPHEVLTRSLNSAAVNWLPLSVTTCGVAPVRSSACWITSPTSAAVIVVSSSQWTT